MLQKKSATTVIVVCIFSTLLFAKKPQNIRTDEGSKSMIEKLNKDVQLTDSQKTILENRAKTFLIKSMGSKDSISLEEKIRISQQAYAEYELALDSVLNESQKRQMRNKIGEREYAEDTKQNKK